MYISVGKGEKTANTGSCVALVSYLEKENKDAQEKIYFFDQARDQVLAEEVTAKIDRNIEKLSKTDAKYFMVTISPSEKELRHIQNNTDELRGYARAVMEAYAAAFDRGITGTDLLYFGKIEHTRTFTGADQAVQLGLVAVGSLKPGLQTHAHIIVSRKDKTQRLKLSPETNHRANRGNFQGGFDKVKFFMAAEKDFDQRFNYMRSPEERFSYWKDKQEVQLPQEASKDQIQQVRLAISQALQEEPTLLSFIQELVKQRIQPVFERDAAGQVVGMSYQLMGNQLAAQRGGKIILTRDEQGKLIIAVQRKREVGPKIAQRLMSLAEKDQLVNRGYTDYLTGFVSKQGKPFAARLYFNSQNELKFSFAPTIPAIAAPVPWSREELQAFVFPASYKGVPLTPAIKKQLLTNQISEFIPQLVTKSSPAKSSTVLIDERSLGPGFDFRTLSQKMSHAIEGSAIQEVERLLAQTKVGGTIKTIEPVVSSPINLKTDQVNKQTTRSFLEKAWHKLGFGQEEETGDNRLERLKRRRKKRRSLTM